jgi:hypothetical protein
VAAELWLTRGISAALKPTKLAGPFCLFNVDHYPAKSMLHSGAAIGRSAPRESPCSSKTDASAIWQREFHRPETNASNPLDRLSIYLPKIDPMTMAPETVGWSYR